MAVLSALLLGLSATKAGVSYPSGRTPWRAQIEGGNAWYPGLGDVAEHGQGLWVSGSYTTGPFRFGAELHALVLPVMSYDVQTSEFGYAALPGDLSVACGGATVGVGHRWGNVGVDLTGALGIARFSVPMDAQFYQEIVVPLSTADTVNQFGLSGVGPWIELNLQGAAYLGDSGVGLVFGPSAGLPMVAGLGMEAAIRLGARADF